MGIFSFFLHKILWVKKILKHNPDMIMIICCMIIHIDYMWLCLRICSYLVDIIGVNACVEAHVEVI